jgi:hypothetical protein
MTNTHTTSRRRSGVALLAGAAFTIAGCIVIAVAQATGNVPDTLFRFPLSHNAAVEFAVYAAFTHALILAGVIWLKRGDVIRGRWATIGLNGVIAGTALLFACELASIPIMDQANSDTWPTIVDAAFGVASILVTFGMIAAGVATLHHDSQQSWRRYAPLICGLLSLVVIPIQFTSAIWVGVAVYGGGYGVLGTALLTGPVGRPSSIPQAA